MRLVYDNWYLFIHRKSYAKNFSKVLFFLISMYLISCTFTLRCDWVFFTGHCTEWQDQQRKPSTRQHRADIIAVDEIESISTEIRPLSFPSRRNADRRVRRPFPINLWIFPPTLNARKFGDFSPFMKYPCFRVLLTLDETPEQRLSQDLVQVQVARYQVHDDGHAIAEHGRVGRLLLNYFEFLDVNGQLSAGHASCTRIITVVNDKWESVEGRERRFFGLAKSRRDILPIPNQARIRDVRIGEGGRSKI